MKSTLVVFAAVFALLFAFAAAQSCDNPVFPGDWQQESTPTTSTLDICPSGVQLNGQSCCSAATEAAIESWFDQVAAGIRSGVQQLDAINLPSKPDCNGCTSAQKKALDKVWKAFGDYLDALKSHVGPCFEGLLRYLAGLSCFVCSPQWEQYVVDNLNGTYVINLSDSTCSELQGDCIAWLLATANFYDDIKDALEELAGLDDDGDNGDDDWDLPCNTTDSCRPYICLAFIGGFNVDSSATVATPFGARSTAAVSRDTAATRRMLKSGLAADDKLTVRQGLDAIRALSQAPHNVLRAIVDINVAAHARTNTPTSVSNNYTSNGYNAYEVGSQSNLNTSANSAASLLVSALAAVLALALAVLL